jgi:hypothetical protein
MQSKQIENLNCAMPHKVTIQWPDLKIPVKILNTEDWKRLCDIYDEYTILRNHINPKTKRFTNWIKDIEYDIFYNTELMDMDTLDILEQLIFKKTMETLGRIK